MSENGINKKISLDSTFKGPSLKPVNSNNPKLSETNQTGNNSNTKNNNLAFTIAGLNGASTKEQLQISASKHGDRSGPAGLPSKSTSYELPSWDNDDYGDNSFNIT
jgi:hypothetical protein